MLKVDGNFKEQRKHKGKVQENANDFRLRREMGQGKTEALLNAEHGELEKKTEELKQAMRIIDKERRAVSSKEETALVELQAVQKRLEQLSAVPTVCCCPYSRQTDRNCTLV